MASRVIEDFKSWHSDLKSYVEQSLKAFENELIKNRIKVTFSISPEDKEELKQIVNDWRRSKDLEQLTVETKRLNKEFEDRNPIGNVRN